MQLTINLREVFFYVFNSNSVFYTGWSMLNTEESALF